MTVQIHLMILGRFKSHRRNQVLQRLRALKKNRDPILKLTRSDSFKRPKKVI